MNATETPFFLPTEISPWFVKTFFDAIPQAYKILWDNLFIPFFIANYVWIILVLFIIFTYVSIKAFMGRWGSLGSFLYNFFYFGILFIVGLVWGPETFASDLFKLACTAILYPLCYLISGSIMDKMVSRCKYFKIG